MLFSTCVGLAPRSNKESTEGFIVVTGECYSFCRSLHKARLYFCATVQLYFFCQSCFFETTYRDTQTQERKQVKNLGKWNGKEKESMIYKKKDNEREK